MARRGRIKVDTFFNANAVLKRVDATTRSVLSKFGAFVRTTSQRSMKPAARVKVANLTDAQRERKKAVERSGRKYRRPYRASRPGQPPRYITKHLRRLIFFGYDATRKSVVVGPVVFESADAEGIPRTLEEGGTSVRTIAPDKGRRVRIRPRPYMVPALRENEPQLPDLWRDAMKK